MRKILIKKILNNLGIEYSEIFDPESGYRNECYPIKTTNGAKLNLIIFKAEEGSLRKIRNANEFGRFLFENGVNVRYPISRIVRLEGKSGRERYACVYNYLEGKTIPWETYTSKHIKLVGGKMGELHRIAGEFNRPKENFDLCTEILFSQLEEMEVYFDKENVKEAMKEKLGLVLDIDFEKFKTVLNHLKYGKKCLLHMDFVRGNILFSEDKDLKIEGIIDFEKVCLGPRILDIARTLAFLLVDCKYKSDAKIRKYFLYNGYQKRGGIKLPDLEYLETLLDYFWLYDFYKFLKHNPYEYLHENEHFLRTCEKLFNK